MALTALGLNHQSAPIAIRERGAVTPDTYHTHLQTLQRHHGIDEALLLSTCNRTEVYCASSNAKAVNAWFHDTFHCAPQHIDPYLYLYHEQAVVKHAMRLASGLDSMVIGEPQILGQLKKAYRVANQTGTLGEQLHRLFQYVFAATKQIRTTSNLSAYPISMAFIAVDLAKKIFSDLTQTTAILIGTGQTTDLVSHYLKDKGIKRLIIFSRSTQRAEQFAKRLGGQGYNISTLSHYLSQADLVISATSTALPVIGKGMVEQAIKQRKHRPMLMVDLASPRDIEAQVSELDDVYLYNIDDLQKVIEDSMGKRRACAKQAEALIEAHVEYYTKRLQRLDSSNLLRQFRQQHVDSAQTLLTKALGQLAKGESAEQVLLNYSENLTNKLLHHPSIYMREAALIGDLQSLEQCRKIFSIEQAES